MSSYIPFNKAGVQQPPFFNLPDFTWANEQLASLSLEEKIAQLLHVAAYSNRDQQHLDYLLQLTKDEKIGGVIYFQGDPQKQSEMTNKLQDAADIPLFVSIDGEWGLAMRLNDTIAFPYQIALGAMDDTHEELIYEMGREIGKHCRTIGIHMNFAPTIDINNNPKNPVIGFRSFGESKYKVAANAYAYMKGMQDEGVLACGKHFPGHGDTDSDSHFTLPLISHSLEHLQENEFYPFQELQKKGTAAMMIAHLNVPALEKQEGLPSTLSHSIVTGQLKQSLGFNGLIFTDALDMKGISAHFKPGEIETKALLAGNDVLLFTVDVKKAKAGILEAVENGLITEKEIDERCLKLLKAKQWLGLDNIKAIDKSKIDAQLHNEEAIVLNQQLSDKSITFYKNESIDLPLSSEKNVAVLSISGDPDAEIKLVKAFDTNLAHHFSGKEKEDKSDELTLFQKQMGAKGSVSNIRLNHLSNESDLNSAKEQLSATDIKVIALHLTGMKTSSGFGITPQIEEMVNLYSEDANSFFVVFGNIYALNKLEKLKSAKNVLLCYQDSAEMQKSASKVLLGEIKAQGKLPVTL
ncbi:glycoside hydrolase family 3 protein [Chondrinema litorale]|uniref:glycoside hydrolase family 3 protein n=1 Tax=Chondrinema litorale TaxID=2994555 RepID=UPI002542B083|nr:glycoside hydrolase family 3 N-terminal domain-containing protein [Chondrinema litorale]UZR94771.1 hypothetical protein OQ292_02940 [Chondrinema litorale]